MNESLTKLLHRIADWSRTGRSGVCCAVVSARGSTPQSPGALMLVDEAGRTYGTIGGGCVEAEVRTCAIEHVNRGTTGLHTFKLNHDYGWDDGLICGGTIEVAIAALPDADLTARVRDEVANRWPTRLPLDVTAGTASASHADLPAGAVRSATNLQTNDSASNPDVPVLRYWMNLPVTPRLYIAGAGHVGAALATLARRLEFAVTVFDDRADLLRRFDDDEIRTAAGDIADGLSSAPVDEHTYCVIVTRGHRHDERALAAVVDRGAAYVGMIGSRRKVKLIKDDLVEMGYRSEALNAIHAPIGLDIGSITVEEIALSIAAQLVSIRRSQPMRLIDGPEPLAVARTSPTSQSTAT